MFSAAEEKDWKYQLPIAPNNEGLLSVDTLHQIHWREYGNRNGPPVIFVHGGPGGEALPKYARFFNPRRYRIILYDQRGCGQSQPNAGYKEEALTARAGLDIQSIRTTLVNASEAVRAALQRNETTYLISDIETLRNHLKIYQPMHLFGGSWGSTLALAYAMEFPESVKTLILRGIFLCRRKDLDYLYQGNAEDYAADPLDSSRPGAYLFYPEAWKKFVEVIPPEQRDDMVRAYDAIFATYADLLEKQALKATEDWNPSWDADLDRLIQATTAWSGWEHAISYLAPEPVAGNDRSAKFADMAADIAFARIENHYFMHGGFLGGRVERNNNYLLENVSKIATIPVYIVQGQFDQVCPRCQADELVGALRRQGAAVEYILTPAGHSQTERENVKALTEIMDYL
jgi:proline iminopeptidase